MSDAARKIPMQGPAARRPPWLRVKVAPTETQREVEGLVSGLRLHTVCEEARCPNIWECWGQHRTATFLILGDICTRACRYCSVTSGRPVALDPLEPAKVAEAVAHLSLGHAVITSVDRDDLPDHGSEHFVQTIRAIRRRTPPCRIELLIPDFLGDESALVRVLEARPDVLGHNVETVRRLHRKMRGAKGDYERTMQILRRTDAYRRETGAAMTSKSGIMVGLGEEFGEILETFDDLRAAHCDVVTVGQYLNPTKKHAPIARYYPPEEFAELRREALARGFSHCESGPLVRSSYHAHEHVPRP